MLCVLAKLTVAVIPFFLAVACALGESPDYVRHRTVLGFTLGRSTFVEIRAKLGESRIRRCSSEEEAREEICYESVLPDRTKVVFEAGFSGGWNEIDGYRVTSGRLALPCYADCTSTSLVSRNVQTAGGLRLGLTESKVIALLGAPRRRRGEKLLFEWRTKEAVANKGNKTATRPATPSQTERYWDVLDTIEVRLSQSRVVEFDVRHTVTD